MISSLHAIVGDSKGRIWLGSYGEGVVVFDGKTIQPAPQNEFKNQNMLPGSLCDAQGNMYLTVENKAGILKFDGEQKIQRLLEGKAGFYLLETKKKNLLYGTTDGLAIIKNRENCTLKDPNCWEMIDTNQGLKITRVITAVEDNKGRIWIGGGDGLAVYDTLTHRVTNFIRQDNTKDFGIVSSTIDTKGNLWFGTNRGLVFWETPERIDKTFRPSVGFQIIGTDILGTSIVNIVRPYNERWLIVGNNQGFALLDIESFYMAHKRKAIIHFFQENNGYIGGSCEQNAVWIDHKNQIWVAGKKGAVRIQPTSFKYDSIRPKLQLDSLTIGGQTFLPSMSQPYISKNSGTQSMHLFISDDNGLKGDDIQIYYKFSNDTLFKLVSSMKNIKNTEGGIAYQHLETGAYTLEIKAIKNGYFESDILEIKLQITNFWQTSDFWLPSFLFCFIIGAIIISIFRKHGQKMQQIAKEKQDDMFRVREAEMSETNLRREKAQLKIQALMNQLNPHFIGNAFHWVQTRIYQDKEAVDVIEKLADNIRSVFKNTRKNQPYHTLKEELHLLKNYFTIQKLLLGHRLTYVLPSEDVYAAFKDMKVPIMVLQIHCENAIEHGISNKDEGGTVRLIIKEQSLHIRFIVVDDGIGLKKAKEIGSKGTQQGTKMLEELKNIFNPFNENLIRFEYEKDAGIGTRVHILIPKNYNFTLNKDNKNED